MDVQVGSMECALFSLGCHLIDMKETHELDGVIEVDEIVVYLPNGMKSDWSHRNYPRLEIFIKKKTIWERLRELLW